MGIPHVDMVTVGFKIQFSKEVSIRSKTFRQWLWLLSISIKASKTNFFNNYFLIFFTFSSPPFHIHKLHIFKIVPSFFQILNRKSFRYSLYLILHHSTKDQSAIQSYRIKLYSKKSIESIHSKGLLLESIRVILCPVNKESLPQTRR